LGRFTRGQPGVPRGLRCSAALQRRCRDTPQRQPRNGERLASRLGRSRRLPLRRPGSRSLRLRLHRQHRRRAPRHR